MQLEKNPGNSTALDVSRVYLAEPPLGSQREGVQGRHQRAREPATLHLAPWHRDGEDWGYVTWPRPAFPVPWGMPSLRHENSRVQTPAA